MADADSLLSAGHDQEALGRALKAISYSVGVFHPLYAEQASATSAWGVMPR